MAANFWKKHENLYFAVTNTKVIIGIIMFSFVILLAIFGPMLSPYSYDEFAGQASVAPSSEHYFGTTIMGKIGRAHV